MRDEQRAAPARFADNMNIVDDLAVNLDLVAGIPVQDVLGFAPVITRNPVALDILHDLCGHAVGKALFIGRRRKPVIRLHPRHDGVELVLWNVYAKGLGGRHGMSSLG